MQVISYLCNAFCEGCNHICSIILPNWNLEGDLRAKLISVEAVHKRRLLHRILEAVPGLAGYMAGLRFSYVHKFSTGLPDRKRDYKLKK